MLLVVRSSSSVRCLYGVHQDAVLVVGKKIEKKYKYDVSEKFKNKCNNCI